MRETISLHAGQCGNLVGHLFWQTIAKEHSVDEQGHFVGEFEHQVKRLPGFFTESFTGRYVPRALLFDLEPSSLNSISQSSWSSLYHPESFIFGKNGAGNNWTKGFYGEGAVLSEIIQNRIRKVVEICNCFAGFQVYHSVGGGTGSGLISRLIIALKSEYTDRNSTTYSVYPSVKVSDVVVEPYNAILTHHRLIENCDQCACLSNEALFRVCSEKLGIKDPSYGDLNQLCALLAAGATSSMRFPGQLNVDLRKIAVNLVPFPRLHFYCSTFAPLVSKHSDDYVQQTVSSLTQQVFDATNSFVELTPGNSFFLCASVTYRGEDVYSQDVELHTTRIQQQYSASFTEWCPNSIKCGIVNVAHQGFKNSATMFGNNTGIKYMFSRVEENFDTLFRKKAFVHWYTDNGLDDDAFFEAQSNMKDLINELETWSGGAGGNRE
jgi:tubulin beta